MGHMRLKHNVTPHVGVWIETAILLNKSAIIMSLPMWECGLKLIGEETESIIRVTPHVGVWIETMLARAYPRCRMSLPMWECGLKQRGKRGRNGV